MARWNPLRPGVIENNKNRIFKQLNTRFAAVAFLLTTAAIVFHPYSALHPDGKLHVDFLDVGQGDAALVTMPDGATLLIDGGGRPNINPDDMDGPGESFQPDTRSVGEAVVSEYLWSRGLDRVDYILATHADADHIDGLNDVVRNFNVRGAIVARTPADDPEYIRFAESAPPRPLLQIRLFGSLMRVISNGVWSAAIQIGRRELRSQAVKLATTTRESLLWKHW